MDDSKTDDKTEASAVQPVSQGDVVAGGMLANELLPLLNVYVDSEKPVSRQSALNSAKYPNQQPTGVCWWWWGVEIMLV